IERAGGRALAVPADLTDEAQVVAMVRRVADAFGRIDVLLNNATHSGRRLDFTEMTLAEWDEVLTGAPTAFMLPTRGVAKGMTPEERERQWAGRAPLGRMVRPEEVASTALFLASDESSALTGQLINVTAGVVQ